MLRKIKEVSRYVGYFVSIFLILFILANAINVLLGGEFFAYRRAEKLLSISLAIAICIPTFSPRKEFLKKIGILFLVYSSIFLLLLLTNSQALFKNISETISFNLSIVLFLITIASLLAKLKLRAVVLFPLVFITMVPSIIYWLYYSIYNTIFTTDSLIAIMQTNASEAGEFISSYVNIGTIIILFIGLILSAIVTRMLINTPNLTKKSGGVLGGIIIAFISFCNSFNNILTGPIIDFNLVQSKYSQMIYAKQERLDFIKANLNQSADNDGIYILVIGESHNKLYTSPYSYKVDSTPWLKSMLSNPNFIMFNDAYANYTQTVQSLTYALTMKNQYNNLSLDKAPTLIEIANEAGFDTVWLSNQGKFSIWDTAISLIANEAKLGKWVNNSELRIHANVKQKSYDENLLPELKALPLKKRMLIVIHLYGNHGTYKDRYPQEYNKFHNLDNKYVDDYVNSVYYNDQVMKEIFEYAKTMPNFKALLYFSDHGEAVNNGGHSATNYRPEMVTIPMYAYFSNSYIKDYPQEFNILKKAKDYTFTNDLITNTMLSIMHIRLNNLYEPENDLGNSKYNHDFNRFRTLHGSKPLTDWRTINQK